MTDREPNDIWRKGRPERHYTFRFRVDLAQVAAMLAAGLVVYALLGGFNG